MSSPVTKFISRSPRYTLTPHDNRFIRYAHQHDHGQSFTTRYLDISQTGLAFVTDREHAPQVSELIKVEIPLNETQSVAWWARVVRVEEYETSHWYNAGAKAHSIESMEPQVVVAIEFHDLPPGHTRAIREQLDRKFEELQIRKRKERWETWSHFFVGHIWKVIMYMLCIAATFWFLHYFAQPDLIYTGDKGTPWGQRFPQFLWKDKTEKR